MDTTDNCACGHPEPVHGAGPFRGSCAVPGCGCDTFAAP